MGRRCNQITTESGGIRYDEDTEFSVERIATLERELDLVTDVEIDIDDRLNSRIQEETYLAYEKEFDYQK